MWNVTLDRAPDANGLKGFGVAMAAGAGTVLGAAVSLAGGGLALSLPAGAAVTLGTAAWGWTSPHRLEPAYRGWNRAARAFARRARPVVLAVSYHTVLRAAALVSTAPLSGHATGERDGETVAPPARWSERVTMDPARYASQAAGLDGASEAPGGDFLRWARATGRPWAIALAPFLLLLAAYDTGDASEPPASIYTLY
jgi:hypothetical protein